jgi:peptidoglycan/LPS O-acetylase OafA/YrhL
MGALAGWIWQRRGAAIRDASAASLWARSGACDLLLVALVILLGALLQHVVKLTFEVEELNASWWHLVEGALWTAIVLLLLLAPLRLKGLIANRPLMLLGRWSYSLYLIHYPVLSYAILRPPARRYALLRAGGEIRPVAIGVVLASCVALSAASYRFIERPFLRRARIGGRQA